MTSAQFPDLKDTSVFVSGGASGIGAALVEGFAAQGARVAFCDLADGTALADGIENAHGTRPLAVTADVTDIPALQAAIASAERAHGPVTTLVSNAAWDDRHATLDVTEAYWDQNQAVNLKHQFFAAQAVIPGMKEVGGGSIINFSSTSYMLGMGGMASYTAAKSAILGLTRSLARDFGPDHIRVNAVMPGWVLTERQLQNWASPEALDEVANRMCWPDHMAPADMVGPVLFLASDAARLITGQAIVVDGGLVHTG